MQYSEWFEDRGNQRIFRCSWLIEQAMAVVQLSHGMGEHIGRYQDFALFLNAQGFSVYGADHRGHGKSSSTEMFGHMPAQATENGWQATVSDAADFSDVIKAQHPELPLFLFGHSMGSMIAQHLLGKKAESYQAVILSGSPGFVPRPLARVAKWIAGFESWRLGETGDSSLLQRLVFADSNKAFNGPAASGFEWLSRDDEQVQKYLQDPACGFVLRSRSMQSMFAGSLQTSGEEFVECIPKSLPILLLSGSDDPVHDGQRNLQRLFSCYQKHQLSIEKKIYPGGRHEILNETNRQEVMADISAWLIQKLS